MTTHDLYGVAEQECVEITPYRLQKRDALSLIDEDGRCYIAIDPTKITSGADEKTKIAHELGHCVTGSFYNVYSSCDFRQRHEARADKWAIKRLLPEDELHDAVANGHTERWERADGIDVKIERGRKAVSWDKYGKLDTV